MVDVNRFLSSRSLTMFLYAINTHRIISTVFFWVSFFYLFIVLPSWYLLIWFLVSYFSACVQMSILIWQKSEQWKALNISLKYNSNQLLFSAIGPKQTFLIYIFFYIYVFMWWQNSSPYNEKKPKIIWCENSEDVKKFTRILSYWKKKQY